MSPTLLVLTAVAVAGPLDRGAALEAEGFPLAAAADYRQAVAETGSPEAVARLLAIADQIGDTGDLPPLLADVDAAPLSPELQGAVRLHQGIDRLDRGDLRGAIERLRAVPLDHPDGPRAHLLTGLLYARQTKLKSAVREFRDVYRASDDPETQDQALLQIARIYYGIERYHQATTYYRLIHRDGALWARSLHERAWAAFLSREPEEARGHLLTLRAPSLAVHSWLPDAPLLEATLDLQECAWGEVEARAARAMAALEPMAAELGAARARGPDGAWTHWFGDPDTDQTHLPAAFFGEMLTRRELAGAARRLEALDAELERALPIPPDVDVVGDLRADRAATLARADRVVYAEIVEQHDALEHVLDQLAILRFENADAQRAAFPHPLQLSAEESARLLHIGGARWTPTRDAAFNGEFWADELGTYRVYAEDRCR